MASLRNGRCIATNGLASAAAVIALTLPLTTAEAAIRCSQGYQTVRGSEIATPYCQDEYVAQVARQYGVRTSGAEIRNNPNRKREVCRLVGRDIRISQACIDAFPSGRGFRF